MKGKVIDVETRLPRLKENLDSNLDNSASLSRERGIKMKRLEMPELIMDDKKE